jgi:hypothetical protein
MSYLVDREMGNLFGWSYSPEELRTEEGRQHLLGRLKVLYEKERINTSWQYVVLSWWQRPNGVYALKAEEYSMREEDPDEVYDDILCDPDFCMTVAMMEELKASLHIFREWADDYREVRRNTTKTKHGGGFIDPPSLPTPTIREE